VDISFLLDIFEEHAAADAMACQDTVIKYSSLGSLIDEYREYLKSELVARGSVVALKADFSPEAVALLLVLAEADCIVVPLTASVEALSEELMKIAEAEYVIVVNKDEGVTCTATNRVADHELLVELRSRMHPGLILFTSGSSGVRKAVVHDFSALFEKFRARRVTKRTLTFFLFDHIGGIDTLLHTLSNGGCVITTPDRQVDSICQTVELHKVEVLPVSPTFINLMLLSGVYHNYDLSSLQIVTYGTEVMSQQTLDGLCRAIPHVRVLQKYGLSEVGALRSKSESNDSCWVKLGGEGVELRVVDGLLEIKSKSQMLGYMNSPSPFTDDGWFMTGDAVEVKGEYFHILGRQSEQINVGGEKFFPAESEAVLQEIDGVIDVSVTARANPLTGNTVVATFCLEKEEPLSGFRIRMRAFCKNKLPSYMVPQKVLLQTSPLHSERYKKIRR